MKVIYNMEDGAIIAVGDNLHTLNDQGEIEVSGRSVRRLSEYKVVNGELKRLSDSELEKVKRENESNQRELKTNLESFKVIFDNDSNTAKDRITALVDYLKEIKAVR